MTRAKRINRDWLDEKPRGSAAGVLAWLLPLVPAIASLIFYRMAGSTHSFVYWAASFLILFIGEPVFLVWGIFLGAFHAQTSRRWGIAAVIFNASALLGMAIFYASTTTFTGTP